MFTSLEENGRRSRFLKIVAFIALPDAGLSDNRAHIGMYTELGILSADARLLQSEPRAQLEW